MATSSHAVPTRGGTVAPLVGLLVVLAGSGLSAGLIEIVSPPQGSVVNTTTVTITGNATALPMEWIDEGVSLLEGDIGTFRWDDQDQTLQVDPKVGPWVKDLDPIDALGSPMCNASGDNTVSHVDGVVPDGLGGYYLVGWYQDYRGTPESGSVSDPRSQIWHIDAAGESQDPWIRPLFLPIVAGGPGQFDQRGITGIGITKEGATYTGWYGGRNNANFRDQMGYATDGGDPANAPAFTKFASNPGCGKSAMSGASPASTRIEIEPSNSLLPM